MFSVLTYLLIFVRNNMLDKKLLDLGYVGVTFWLNDFKTEIPTGVFNDAVITFIDKTDGSASARRE